MNAKQPLIDFAPALTLEQVGAHLDYLKACVALVDATYASILIVTDAIFHHVEGDTDGTLLDSCKEVAA